MQAFVVYELQAPRSFRDRDDQVGKRLPVKHSLQMVGCFIANDEGEACAAAAESQQRAAHYIALAAKVQAAKFEAVPDGDLPALSGLQPSERQELMDELRTLRKAIESKKK